MDIRDICILYAIKELYIIPNKYSKLFYVYVLSPLVVCNGFYNTGFITNKYWKFLRSMCYPGSQQITYNGYCNVYHNTECSDIVLKQDYLKTLRKISYLYFKYYLLHGIYMLIVKKSSINSIIKKEVENWFRSTIFLFIQNTFQRLFMCKINNISPIQLYFITSICSNSIFFENINRVKYINTMMISNISISILQNYKSYKNKLTFILLMLTLSKNKYIKLPTLLLSIFNTFHEYRSNDTPVIPKSLTEETPILSLPWHPFI